MGRIHFNNRLSSTGSVSTARISSITGFGALTVAMFEHQLGTICSLRL
jgi:hypothetical protein